MSTTSVPRFHAALDLEKAKTLALLSLARVIYAALLAEVATFPAPAPTLAILLAEINALDTAQQAVASGLCGPAASVRNTARDTLWSSLLSLKLYVQKIADASPEIGFTILKSSGFTVVAPYTRDKPLLGARLTPTSGQVKLTANVKQLTGGSAMRPTFNWAYSVDGGHTWVAVPSTPRGTTTISGLPLLTTPSFRVCVTLAEVTQPWSQAVTILVP